MIPSHDLIIIGAGPAGSAAAVTAVKAGLRVAVVDKSRFPRDKLCGGGFTGRSRRHMREIFGCDVDERFLPCTRVRLSARGQVLADLPDAPPIWMTMRRELDTMLLARAGNAGCDLLTGRRIAAFCAQTGRVTLAGGTTISAHAVIGADGANSMVARKLFGRPYDPRKIGFGMEVEAPPGQDDPPVEIDFAAARWGYGWVFPKHGSRTIGVGGLHAHNPVMRDALDLFVSRHGGTSDRLERKGAFLPFGDVRAVPGKGRVLLAGDAAGLVDPLTGEGIAWAMRSGQLAAEAAIAASGTDRLVAEYCRRLRPVHAELRRARLLRQAFYHPAVQPLVLRLLSRDQRLQRRYLALLAGDLDYSDLGWRSLPRLGFRLFARTMQRPVA